MDPHSGFKLGPFHAGGISVSTGFDLVVGFIVLSLLLVVKLARRLSTFSWFSGKTLW